MSFRRYSFLRKLMWCIYILLNGISSLSNVVYSEIFLWRYPAVKWNKKTLMLNMITIQNILHAMQTTSQSVIESHLAKMLFEYTFVVETKQTNVLHKQCANQSESKETCCHINTNIVNFCIAVYMYAHCTFMLFSLNSDIKCRFMIESDTG